MLADFIRVSSNLRDITSLLVTGLDLYSKCINNVIGLGDETIKKEYQDTLIIVMRTFNCFSLYAKSMIPRLESITKQLCIADTILNQQEDLNDQGKKSIEIVIDQISQHLEAIQKYENERVKNSMTDNNLNRLYQKVIKEINNVKENNIIQKHSSLASTVIGTLSSSVAYVSTKSGPAALIALALASLATYFITEHSKKTKISK